MDGGTGNESHAGHPSSRAPVPTASQPNGLEEHFATFGKALLTVALHQMSHRAHISDAIRAAGRATPVPAGAAA
jgi:hypothetical protein